MSKNGKRFVLTGVHDEWEDALRARKQEARPARSDLTVRGRWPTVSLNRTAHLLQVPPHAIVALWRAQVVTPIRAQRSDGGLEKRIPEPQVNALRDLSGEQLARLVRIACDQLDRDRERSEKWQQTQEADPIMKALQSIVRGGSGGAPLGGREHAPGPECPTLPA